MVAIGITAFYIVNLFGSKFMAKIQNYLSVILIAGLLLLGIFGVLNGLPDSLDITQEGYFLGGTDGFYQAVMILMPSVYAASNDLSTVLPCYIVLCGYLFLSVFAGFRLLKYQDVK